MICGPPPPIILLGCRATADRAGTALEKLRDINRIVAVFRPGAPPSRMGGRPIALNTSLIGKDCQRAAGRLQISGCRKTISWARTMTMHIALG